MVAKELYGFLKQLPLFEVMAEEDLDAVAQIVKVKNYKKNMIIFMEGEPGEGVFCLIQGLVKIFKVSRDGREQTLHFIQPGGVFAEVVLFDGGSYPATAQVLEDAKIFLIRNEDINQLIRENSELSRKLFKVMSKRLREAKEKVRDFALYDTLGRVIITLLRLAREHGSQVTEGTEIQLKISRQELANYTGTSRETVTRILSELKKSKAIDIQRQTIVLRDEAKLRSWL